MHVMTRFGRGAHIVLTYIMITGKVRLDHQDVPFHVANVVKCFGFGLFRMQLRVVEFGNGDAGRGGHDGSCQEVLWWSLPWKMGTGTFLVRAW